MNQSVAAARRLVYCVLSARSLPYARHAMQSLVTNCHEAMELTLITDSAADKTALVEAMEALSVPPRHRWRVYEQAECDTRAEALLARHPHIAAFRFGHPCWRKITDPMLFAAPGEEMIILDPDLYFPNRFAFEPTPATGLLLMYQPPSCLLPHDVVMRAYAAGIQLAHHVDIGVAHVRNDIDLDWLDALIAKLGGEALPRAMHIEAIVWAALAMRIGGGYLDPTHWHCWRNSQWKRLALHLGVAGTSLLRVESFSKIKCFHGGGIAKWWIPTALEIGQIPAPVELTGAVPPMPFVELTERDYLATQRVKSLARRLGYYKILGA